MKNALFLVPVFLLSFCSFLHARDLKLKIVSQGEPLGYAYVFLNGKVYAAADSAGVTYIPRTRLQPGDTLSASYVGAKDAFFICREGNIPSDSLVLDLRRDYALDEVVVSVDPRKLFKKYVRTRWPLYNNQKFEMNFHIETTAKGCLRKGKGTLTLAFNTRMDSLFRYKCLNIRAEGDTAGAVNQIAYLLKTSFAGAFDLNNPFREKTAVIRYLGMEDGKRAFTWVYQNGKTTVQLLILADKTTKSVDRLTVSFLFPDKHGTLSATYAHPSDSKYMILTRLNTSLQSDTGNFKQRVSLTDIRTSPYRGMW